MSTSEILLVIASCLTGIATVITAWAALIRSKRDVRTEEEARCQERLKEARSEAEALSDELHQRRMDPDEAS